MPSDSSILNIHKEYSVSVWEGVGITIATLGLVIFALIGLGVKTLRNAFDPQRAEAIANSLVEYQLPGKPQYVFGINIGGVTAAVITSSPPHQNSFPQENSPDVSLIFAKARQEDKNPDTVSIPALSYHPIGDIQVTDSRTENKILCGQLVPVTIQQGTLASDQQPTLAAVRYEASVLIRNRQRYVELVATGSDAQQKAEKIFYSLQCKP